VDGAAIPAFICSSVSEDPPNPEGEAIPSGSLM